MIFGPFEADLGHFPIRVNVEICKYPTAIAMYDGTGVCLTLSPLVRLPCHAVRHWIRESGNEEVSYWTNTQLSHLQDREGSRRRTPC